VIAGALVFLIPDFQLSAADQGMVVSIILLGGLAGALVAGRMADNLGRKRTIEVSSLLLILGAVMIVLCESYSILLLGRFLTGIGVGILTVAAPLYLGEIAPASKRGGCVALFQLLLTLGMGVSFLVNYLFADTGEWRWMFGVGIFPVVLQFILLLFLPETPSWLLTQGFEKRALQTLQKLRKDVEWKSHVQEMENSAKAPRSGIWKMLLSSKLRFVLVVGVCLSIAQLVTGINIVMFFAPKILQDAGFGSTTGALLATLGIGTVNFLATALSTWLLDRKGRRILLLIGIGGMALSLAGIALAFLVSVSFGAALSFMSMMTYVAFFAIGLGPVTWVLLAEIYPLKVRGLAMTVALFFNWLSNYLVALTFLDLVGWVGSGGTFLIYTVITLGAFLFVWRYIPETKGKSLEEIERQLVR
jgi:sugar porter (SP) family MFS transporter